MKATGVEILRLREAGMTPKEIHSSLLATGYKVSASTVYRVIGCSESQSKPVITQGVILEHLEPLINKSRASMSWLELASAFKAAGLKVSASSLKSKFGGQNGKR